MQNSNDKDYLFILTDDKVESHKELLEDCYISDEWHTLNLGSELIFDNSEVHICKDFRSKLCYLFATLHEDTMLVNLVHSILPEVHEIELPRERYSCGFNIIEWQKEYNFTLEDFLTNKKYIVISDAHDSVGKIIDLGLFNWEDIYATSIPLEE